MIIRNAMSGGALSVLLALACAGQAVAQAGPGASVEWKVGPDAIPTVFYDGPSGYDRQYRICFKKFSDGTSIEVVLADRSLKIVNEDCLDVKSNKIAVRMVAGTETATGIFFLID
jgi:hypothetical protein